MALFIVMLLDLTAFILTTHYSQTKYQILTGVMLLWITQILIAHGKEMR